jgi:4-amino-4-deoxy-L-arabinose transferase-like glycosyltransferase
VALPWYVIVGVRTDGAWLAGFLGKHNVARFTGAMEGHSGSVFYYVAAELVGFFPWSCFLPPAIYCLWKRLRSKNDLSTRSADTFVACWAGLYLVFFSLARTKLPSYVLPCYPALAIATGAFLDEWLRRPATIARWWFRSALYTPALVGVVLVIGLPIVAAQLLPGEEWLGVFGIMPIVGTAALIWAERTGRNALVPHLFAAMSVVFIASLVGGAAVQVSQRSTSPAIAAAVRNAAGSDARLIGFRHFDPTLPFYLHCEVPLVDSAEQLRAACERWPEACIVTRDEHLNDLAAALGASPEIISRHPRFLRKHGELVVALPHNDRVIAQQSDRQTR